MKKHSETNAYHYSVLNSVSKYKKTWLLHKTGAETSKEKEEIIIDRLLKEYHNETTTEERKRELKHDIIIHIFFLFPFFLKKHCYIFSKEFYEEALQNMTQNTLRAIETFNPNMGFKFSNYLIGYFKEAVTTTFKSMNVVPKAPLRQANLAQTLPLNREGTESPYIVCRDNEPPHGTEGEYSQIGKWQEEDHKDNDAQYASELLNSQYANNDDEENWHSPEEFTLSAPTMRVIHGTTQVRNTVEKLEDSRLYPLALGIEKDDIEDKIHLQELVQWLKDAVRKDAGLLTDEECFIIINHFGLFSHPPMKYREIAKIRKENGTGSSCSRISQITTSAIQKLRKFFCDNGIEP